MPDGSWPDAVGTGGSLDLVRRFCNSINREQGGDAWRDVDDLDSWLRREGYDVERVTVAFRDKMLELRDVMWRSIVHRSLSPLAHALEHCRLQPLVDGARLRLVATDATDATSDVVAARLVEVIVEAQSTDTWERLKACQHCGWIFVDASRNRSGRWCSMSACGGREKARAYRSRRRGPHEVGSGR